MTKSSSSSTTVARSASLGWIGSNQISVMVVTVSSVVCSSVACTALAASESWAYSFFR